MKAACIWMYFLSESVSVTCQILLLLQFFMMTNSSILKQEKQDLFKLKLQTGVPWIVNIRY